MGTRESLPSAAALAAFREAWPGGIWIWDGRNDCVVCSFSAQKKKTYEAVVTASFPVCWDQTNVAQSPPGLQALIDETGGLRPGQRAFSQVDPGERYAFVLWWPWGDGASISVRIGLVGTQSEELLTLRAMVGIKG